MGGRRHPHGRDAGLIGSRGRSQEESMRSVLVIDDDVQVRRYLRELLERDGFRVVLAEDGEQGLACFRQQRPDLVITDLFMPHREGLETIQLLRGLDPAVPVIAMSGKHRQLKGSLFIAARHLGACDALSKPFSNDELRAAVGRVLAPA